MCMRVSCAFPFLCTRLSSILISQTEDMDEKAKLENALYGTEGKVAMKTTRGGKFLNMVMTSVGAKEKESKCEVCEKDGVLKCSKCKKSTCCISHSRAYHKGLPNGKCEKVEGSS